METTKLELHAHHDEYRIALYYVYVELNCLEEVVCFHESFRDSRIFGGRIRISSEGINGVLSGRLRDLEHYEGELESLLYRITETNRSTDLFQPWELDVKYCHLRTDLTVESQLFPDWHVQMTNSVVELMDLRSIGNIDPLQSKVFAKSGNTDSDPNVRLTRRRRHHLVIKNHDFNQLQKYHLEIARSLYHKSVLSKVSIKEPLNGALHLSPLEWNRKLDQLIQQQADSSQNIVLLDCRNCYESAVGYFQVPNTTTLLANTRKFSELPFVLVDQLSKQDAALRKASHIFMYCTGGVRCERASVFLQAAISEMLSCNLDDKSVPDRASMPCIYQLHGGIQRYLEISSASKNVSSYFKGKNFVFDLRRTDPTIIRNGTDDQWIVGKCLVCEGAHDDYDNGHAPITKNEARCFKCRILVLVCNRCRPAVVCWGDEIIDGEGSECSPDHRPKLYCGGLHPKECLYMPPVLEIRDC